MSRTDSAAPPEANPQVRPPRRGADGPLGFVWASVVMAWRWLIRMRTALYLLGLVGLETLIATVVPQEPNVAETVDAWRTGAEGPGTLVSGLIDAIGGYDVYGSPAFLALLLLLFLSLTACLIPRVRSWVRLVRHSRPPLTRNAGRQEVVTRLSTDRSADDAHDAATTLLRERHWRVRREGSPTGGPPPQVSSQPPAQVSSRPPAQVAAEKGLWSREGGSLLFHISFYVLLAAIVFGQLLSFEGQRAVVEGERFADTPVSYWTYRPGRWWNETSHSGWALGLEQFHVDWVRDPLAPGAGQPTMFRSDVELTRADGTTETTVIEGNAPLVVDGMKIHQLDWGYAPRVQVEVDGEVIYEDFLTTTRTDAGHFRAAVKAPAAEPDVGMSVFFYPYAPNNDAGEPVPTGAPFADAPLLLFQMFRGDLQLGRTAQTVNELDTSQLESAGGAWLREGAEVDMGDGVVIRFLELRRWVGFQVSARPQIPYLLLAAGLLLAGLWPALYAYRRRLWIVAEPHPTDPGSTLVTVAGRAFQRPQAFDEEHADVVERLAARLEASPIDDDAPATPAPSPVTADTAPAGDQGSGVDT